MKTFGIVSSILMWAVAVWALAQPVKTDLHTGIIIVAAVILVVHFVEVSFYFWHPRMRRHLSAYNFWPMMALPSSVCMRSMKALSFCIFSFSALMSVCAVGSMGLL